MERKNAGRNHHRDWLGAGRSQGRVLSIVSNLRRVYVRALMEARKV